MSRKRRIVNNNDSNSKLKNHLVRGKDANIYLGAILAIIACMYSQLDPVLQVINNNLNSNESLILSIIDSMKENVGTVTIFCIKISVNLIGFIIIFVIWRLAEKRDLGE